MIAPKDSTDNQTIDYHDEMIDSEPTVRVSIINEEFKTKTRSSELPTSFNLNEDVETIEMVEFSNHKNQNEELEHNLEETTAPAKEENTKSETAKSADNDSTYSKVSMNSSVVIMKDLENQTDNDKELESIVSIGQFSSSSKPMAPLAPSMIGEKELTASEMETESYKDIESSSMYSKRMAPLPPPRVLMQEEKKSTESKESLPNSDEANASKEPVEIKENESNLEHLPERVSILFPNTTLNISTESINNENKK